MTQRLWLPSTARRQSGTKDILVYMITGNPGCIGFYDDFIRSLRALVAPLEGPVAFHFHGKDLAGFGDDGDNENHTPYDLEAQIQLSLQDLASMRVESPTSTPSSLSAPPPAGRPYDLIILVGHSVGAYIVLEIFHRFLHDPAAYPSLTALRHGILLFPTVTHIAQSRSGVKLDYLRTHPWLDNGVQQCIHAFLALWSLAAVAWVVQHVLGFDAHAAAVTARWVKSRHGVRQALFMGKNEMATITEERWSAELWEVSAEALDHGREVPKFFFFFGRDDHWVSNRFRAEFIARRREHTKGRTRVEIDEGNLRHNFCVKLQSSLIVAQRVKGWIEEIVQIETGVHAPN